jgi:hypothetical protein
LDLSDARPGGNQLKDRDREGQARSSRQGVHRAQISGFAQLERGDGVVQAIDAVLFTIFRMVVHPFDEFRRNIAGRKLHYAGVQQLAISQKFDVSKDLRLARFGSGSQCVRNSDVEASPEMTGNVVSSQAIPAGPLLRRRKSVG